MTPQVYKLLWRKLKHKIIWEPFRVAFDGLEKNFGWHAIKFCQVGIEHNLLVANQINRVRDSLYWDDFEWFFHVCVCNKTGTSAPKLEVPIWHLKIVYC